MAKTPRGPAPSQRDLMTALGHAMRGVSTATVLFHQSVAERIGLNATDHKGLDVILEHGPMTAGELARRTGLSTGGVTGILDRLERAGFARRERDPEDRRRVIIRVDEARAERLIAPLFVGIATGSEKMLSSYATSELALILDFTQKAIALLAAETVANAATPRATRRPRSTPSP